MRRTKQMEALILIRREDKVGEEAVAETFGGGGGEQAITNQN